MRIENMTIHSYTGITVYTFFPNEPHISGRALQKLVMKNGIRKEPKIPAIIKLKYAADFEYFELFNIKRPKSKQTTMPPIQLKRANKPCKLLRPPPDTAPVNAAITEIKIPAPTAIFLIFSFTFSSFRALPR